MAFFLSLSLFSHSSIFARLVSHVLITTLSLAFTCFACSRVIFCIQVGHTSRSVIFFIMSSEALFLVWYIDFLELISESLCSIFFNSCFFLVIIFLISSALLISKPSKPFNSSSSKELTFFSSASSLSNCLVNEFNSLFLTSHSFSTFFSSSSSCSSSSNSCFAFSNSFLIFKTSSCLSSSFSFSSSTCLV